ncbi:hypothetical protein F444_16034, partial [Phytophthora nicotianae P1976]
MRQAKGTWMSSRGSTVLAEKAGHQEVVFQVVKANTKRKRLPSVFKCNHDIKFLTAAE